MKGDLLVVHGGAPTAVMNASLYGVIMACRESGDVERILGARGGVRGILDGHFMDLSALPEETVEALPSTPASYIGTSRYPLEAEDYDRLAERLRDQGIRYVLLNGGNGTMDTCGKLVKAVDRRAPGSGIRVVGIPKTIDNDIAVTDHAPGFGSAARYLAASTAELAQDLASLPIHVCVMESMGRNSGWLTAASALARSGASGASGSGGAAAKNLGPHLVYVPELPFDEERFLDEAKALYDRFGGVLVVASEGLRDSGGKPIVPPIFSTGRSVYFGDVSAHLAGLVIRKLGIKARSEKPGILGRCSIAHQSSVDREEAMVAGREAAFAAMRGESGVMVAFRRVSSAPYRCETFLAPVEDVMLRERLLPREYLNDDANDILDSYLEWCGPLIGGDLPAFAPRVS